jgi:multiple sugar transport system substrate-binding protein
MPTIKDIATRAGVSHGTVSNVLNKRGNVSAEKIKLVEKIAKEMGYKMNVQAQQLRAGVARKVCIILPKISVKNYNDLYSGIEQYLQNHEFSIELTCTNNIECVEEKAIKKALSYNPMAIVVVSSLMKNKGLFTPDARFFFAERKVKGIPDNAIYASFSFGEAGRSIAMKCVEDGHKNIALFCENSMYSNNKSFINGAVEVLEDYNCSCKIFFSDDSMWLNKAFDILNSKEDFDAIIAMSKEYAEYLKTAHQYNLDKKMPSIYALTSKSIGIEAAVNRYELNYKLLGKKIAERIVKLSDEERDGTNESENIIIDNDGFYLAGMPKENKDSSISFLTIQNATSKAIQMLLPSFTKATGIKVNMIEMSYDELYKMSKEFENSCPYDLIRIDMAWMADVGNKIYRPLDKSDLDIGWLKKQIISTLSDNYSMINGVRYALPFDACVQMLFYRKDLFEDELIKREFFEKHKRKLEIPETFDEYNEVAKFFTRKFNEKSRTQYGATTTYGRAFLAACDLLPRFREFKTDIFDSEGYVNIMIPEMQKAIHNYLETCKYTSNDIYQWWREPAQQFSDGKTAMNIVFSTYASEMINDSNSKVIGKIAFAKVPGGQPLSGGGSIGISKHSKKYEECITFLKWLYHKDTASTIAYLGGYICNNDVSNNADILELYPWIEGMEKSFEFGWRISSHKKNPFFNEFLFEDILGKAIRSIASEIEDVDTALNKAQLECDAAFNSIK